MQHDLKARFSRMPLAIALLGGTFIQTCIPAHAGDQPLYRPAPDWVLPAPVSPSADKESASPVLRLYDVQARIDHGAVWTYVATARRIDTPETMARSGTLTISWRPDHGDLIVHGIEILRDGRKIDVLASGQHFTVLRREAKLESLQLDGSLTATLPITGLQVGDTIISRYSLTEKDPVLLGRVNTAVPLLPQPVPMGFGRARVLWSDTDKVHWKTYLNDVTANEKSEHGWHEWQVSMPVARQPDPAAQAPGRFTRPPLAEFTDFADWAEVSRTMAPLYRIDAPSAAVRPGGELDQEIARIAAATSDPRRRTAMALQLVQDKVRYFAIAMNGGNLVPQTPEQTWSTRYGDCKAKTLLLLAVLHKLGIEAEPALANLHNGDLVHDRLPSVAAFDHVMVLAHVGPSVLWLDGTGLGSREPDLDDVAAYGWVLPVRAAGADLMRAPLRPPARPHIEVHTDIDMRAGVALMAPFQIRLLLRGSLAGQLNSGLASLDPEGKAQTLRRVLGSVRENSIFVHPQFTYDPASGSGTIAASGIIPSPWKRTDGRYTLPTNLVRPSQYPDRSRTIWQAVPVALGNAQHVVIEETFRLSRAGKGIAMQGQADAQRSFPTGGSERVQAEWRDGQWQLSLHNLRSGGELAAADIPAMRRQDADLIARLPSLRTDAGYPAPWHDLEQSRRDHLFDQTIATLDQWVAEKPDDAERYRARAAFYAEIFERQKAIADLTKALALKGDKALYRERAGLYEATGDKDHAVADMTSAYNLDPSDQTTLGRLVFVETWAGKSDEALARLDGLIANGGDREPFHQARKADVLAYRGDAAGALAAINAGLAKRSENAGLLVSRCRLKGLLNTDLDNALADCNHAIQIGGAGATSALGVRGMLQWRLHHWKDAIGDLNQALELNPNQSFLYLLRALAERDGGDGEAARRDWSASRLLNPAMAEYYRQFGLIGF